MNVNEVVGLEGRASGLRVSCLFCVIFHSDEAAKDEKYLLRLGNYGAKNPVKLSVPKLFSVI